MQKGGILVNEMVESFFLDKHRCICYNEKKEKTMKKTLILILTAVMCFGLLSSCREGTEGLEYFKEDSGNYVVEAGDAKHFKNIEIPSKYRFKKVVGIADNAFEDCTELETVIIPDTVKYIGEKAFKGCTSLQSVVISDGVEIIEKDAFQGCTSLKSIVIPGSVEIIGVSAFNGCNQMETLVISDGVKVIEKSAFLNCDSLKNVVIPDSVTSIGQSAFLECSKLEKVTIGNGVKTIDNYAFSLCESLNRVVMGDAVTSIGHNVFSNYDESFVLYYVGSADEFSRISVGDGLEDIKVSYNYNHEQ